jgi:hypothetical protein
MSIAGAERGLGARLIAKWTVYPIRGVGPLRNEKPRMGVRGSLGEGDEWPTWRLLLGAGFGRRERRLRERLHSQAAGVHPFYCHR